MRRTDLKKKLPDMPGVYIFRGSGGKILYIGKATSLSDRVKSYFGKDLMATRGPLLVEMLNKAESVKWQTTDSVLEALILEANLIKKYQPIYNTKEKSGKSFNYVGITKDAFPKIIIERGKNVKHRVFDKVYGPYTSGSSLKEALKIVRKIFPFLDEKSSKNHGYEFYRQLGMVPDIGDMKAKEQYKRTIRHIKLFFAGKKNELVRDMQKEMKTLAKAHKFEEAGVIRNQLFTLKHIQDVSLIKEDPAEKGRTFLDAKGSTFGSRIEAYDIAHLAGKHMVGVMTVIENGEANKNEYRKFKIRNFKDANDPGALLEILERRFNHAEWRSPNLIVVDGGKAQLNAAKKFEDRVGLKIPVMAVVKDERHRPKGILGDQKIARKYEREILLANNEAHRFAIKYHRDLARKLLTK